ncbi:hypothetical protein [Paenibacillus sp. Marseille-Q4541]|uniref:hypothetical protein n=1 Tax=Paenibacillus sp. Marseille-Q4541 TaxID=2831522 RepID=UPI001BAB64AE|nr:hypothetical protein [Paenibacillus sp. Marseille-Q4541]
MKVRNPITFPAIILLVLVMLITGCSAWNQDIGAAEEGTPGEVTMDVVGGSFVPSINQSLQIRYDEGLTIYEVLDRVAGLSKETNQIISVGSIILDDTLKWKVKRNDKEVSNDEWGQSLNDKDSIELSIVPATPIDTSQKDGSAVTLMLNGGPNNPDLRTTIARLYDPTLTVRDLLMSTDSVQLSDNQKYLQSIEGYTPRISEKWVMKVNNKELVEQGLDMILNPGDKVQVEIGDRE